jgi:Protein of unknown function (DUF2842)
MPKRLRTFIGAVTLAVFIPLYAMTAMVIASAKLPGASILIQTVSYAALGLLWVLPAGLIVTWMSRPDGG